MININFSNIPKLQRMICADCDIEIYVAPEFKDSKCSKCNEPLIVSN